MLVFLKHLITQKPSYFRIDESLHLTVSSATGRLQLQTERFCSSCGVRRMAESAALLVDEVLPISPYAMGTQRTLSAPIFICLSAEYVAQNLLGSL